MCRGWRSPNRSLRQETPAAPLHRTTTGPDDPGPDPTSQHGRRWPGSCTPPPSRHFLRPQTVRRCRHGGPDPRRDPNGPGRHGTKDWESIVGVGSSSTKPVGFGQGVDLFRRSDLVRLRGRREVELSETSKVPSRHARSKSCWKWPPVWSESS